MTKTRILQIVSLLVIVTCVCILYFLRQKKPLPSIAEKPTSTTIVKEEPQVIDVERLEINGKRVVGLPAGQEKSEIMKIHVSNRPSDDWKPGLEKALVAQGGNNIKDIKIEKLDSYIWTESGVSLHVDTVKITLKDQKDSSVSFNAMIDSQTGKILKNWNQPVIDNFNHQKKFKVRIDPRYYNN